MRKLRRLLLLAIVVFGVATGVLFAFGDHFAGAMVRRAVARATTVAAARGIELRDVRFARASFAGLGVVRCDGLAGTVVMPSRAGAEGRRGGFEFGATQIVVDAGWPWSDLATLMASGGEVRRRGEDGAATEDRVERIDMRVDFSFSWWSPTASVRVLEDEARRLLRDGETRLALRMSAVARFMVSGQAHELPVRAERIAGGGARVALERADIEQLSRVYTHPLTETEIELVLRHPHRAPTLLRLSEQATRAAAAEHKRDRRFPHDAFRHVYWSWLLTHAFGPEFSEEVTDAHEIGATYEFSASSQRMDLHNNAVGRAYALARVPERELVQRVLTDPNVMRKAASPASGTP